MVAKLIACREAQRGGVASVRIVSGKNTTNLDDSPGTTVGGQ